MDTMGWYCLFDRRDAWHKKGAAILSEMARTKRPLITTDYVVDETATLLMARGATTALEGFFAMLDESSALTVVFVGEPRFQQACDTFLKHRDQGYSFTDVTSFVVMRELKCREVLTHDEHFEKAGFQRLLR